jgi:aminoglycoside phosphotransferase (APT) family kinase protein
MGVENTHVKSLADDLLNYLRKELRNQAMKYSSPPTSLTSGFTTHMYKFQLNEVPDEVSKPLVLRLYPKTFPPGQANLEGLAQNALSDAGYPAPRVFFICSDTTILGGEFIIMKFMPGEMMMNSYPIEIVPEKLAEAHVALHKIDSQPIVEALTEKGFFSLKEKGLFFENLQSVIDLTEIQITTNHLEWLKPSLKWIKDNRPTENVRLAVTHGDFQPFNILVNQGKISAVLDWGGFRVLESEIDVANTKIKFTCLGPFLVPNIDWVQFYNRYYECYSNESPLDQAKVEYYAALWCIRWILQYLVLGWKVLGIPGVQDCLVHRFQEITGIKLKRPS